MSFADEVAENTAAVNNCKTCAWLPTQDDRADIEKVLADEKVSSVAIRRAMAARGFKVARSSIDNHRANHVR